MATGVVAWSTVAASNATADGNVNFAEGQSPSSLNDSCRAAMASVAKFRDDNNGSLTTAGGTTNYTVTSNQGFATLAALHRQSLRILWSVTCAASPTLNVDSLGAKNINTNVGINVGAGALIANAVYDFIYDNNNSVWIVAGAPLTFPSGTVMLFQQAAAPVGWTKSTANDNKALRLVSGGTGGTAAGTTGFTSVFASKTLTQGNLPTGINLTGTPNSATQTLIHQQTGNGAISPSSASVATNVSNTSSNVAVFITDKFLALTDHTVSFPNYTVSLGGSSTALDFAVQYVDVIAASKD